MQSSKKICQFLIVASITNFPLYALAADLEFNIGFNNGLAPVTKEGVTVNFFGRLGDTPREEFIGTSNLVNGGIDIIYAGSGFIPTSLSFDYGGGAGSFNANINLRTSAIETQFGGRLVEQIAELKDSTLVRSPSGITSRFATGTFKFDDVFIDPPYINRSADGSTVAERRDFITLQPTLGAFSTLSFSDPNGSIAAIDNLKIGLESAQSILNRGIDNFRVDTIDQGTAIEAEFIPESEIGPVPVTVLAESLGYSHFNWLNIIDSDISTIDGFNGGSNPKKLVIDNGKILTKTGRIFDPFFKGNFLCQADTTICAAFDADTKDFYYDIDGFEGKPGDYFNRSFVPSNGIGTYFADQPRSPFNPNGEFTNFTTVLVGVRNDDPTFETYDFITSFQWRTNLTCRNQFDCDGFAETRRRTSQELLSSIYGPNFVNKVTGGVEILNISSNIDDLDSNLIDFLKTEGLVLEEDSDMPDNDEDETSAESVPEPKLNLYLLFVLVVSFKFVKSYKPRLS